MEISSVLLFLAGYFAALVANSTGAGGGIVFIPLFTFMGLGIVESVSTSIFIQCFGMSSGAISWLIRKELKFIFKIIKNALIFSLASLIGAHLTYKYFIIPEHTLVAIFGILSLLIGLLALVNWNKHLLPVSSSTSHNALVSMSLMGVPGGVLTSLISIGIGELVYLYVLILRQDIHEAIITAVVTTAFTVILLFLLGPVIYSPNYEIATKIIFGAIVGGYMAGYLVKALGVVAIKRICACVIICTGLFELESLLI